MMLGGVWFILINFFPFLDTPYEGMEFSNWPRYTILRGKVIWADGQVQGKPRDGQYLKRGPSKLVRGAAKVTQDLRRVATWLYE